MYSTNATKQWSGVKESFNKQVTKKLQCIIKQRKNKNKKWENNAH